MSTSPPRLFLSTFRAGLAAASIAISLAAASATALAQDIHAIEPAWDTVQGTVQGGQGARLLPIRLLEGAPYSFEVKADKGSLLHPRAALLGLDRIEDADAAWVVDPKGTKVSVKPYLPKGTGLHWIRIDGADGTTGAWTFKSKVKLPKGASAAGDIGGEGVQFDFIAPGQAIATISVKGAPKESGAPVHGDLRDPDGVVVFGGQLKPTKTGFSLVGVELSKQGHHVLSFLPGPGGPGTYKASVKWKVAKGVKRTLDAALIVADPFLLGLDPVQGDITQTILMELMVDFAQPGATVKFQYGSVVGTILPANITHLPGELRFPLNLSTLGLKGVYDVVLTNPDGGKDTLPAAFTVNMVSPSVVTVAPTQVYGGAVRRLRVSGGDFFPNVAARLRLGATSIPGSVVGAGAGYRDVDFDLTGAAFGFWDIGMTNAGAPEAILPVALEVLETVTVDSMTPADNTGDQVVQAVILGGGFLDGATATLAREAEGFSMPGTGLAVVSRTEIHATFDTNGQEPGMWDLVVTSPGGAVVTLPQVFETRRPKLPPSDPVQPFSATTGADGPASVACDPGSGEYVVAWVEEDTSNGRNLWHVYAQRLDADGAALDKPVDVSDDDLSHAKATPVVGYNPADKEYLVVWTEQMSITPTQTGVQHPSGSSAVDLFQVMAQRLALSDLAKIESNVQVTDGTSYQGSQKGVTWVISDFNSFRPALAFDEDQGQWEIAWMEEWDTTGLYFNDNYDVFHRSFVPSKNLLGALQRPAASDAHEGDPALAWDKAGGLVLAYVATASSKGGDRDLYLGSGGGAAMLLPAKGDELGDPQLAIDPKSGTVVVGWTRVVSDGTRSAEAASVKLSDLSTIVGGVLVLGNGATDMLVRPVANEEFGEVHLFWTRIDAKDLLYAMRRTAKTTADAGLEALEDEVELSAGSGDEGLPAGVYSEARGDTAVLWMEKLTVTGNKTYLGDVLPKGTIRGINFWFQLFR